MSLNIGMFGQRVKPLKDYKAEFGCTPFFRYGANRITGWRIRQEDRLVCLPNVYEKYSIFAIYDGHGGETVAEYLRRNLHGHIIDALKENQSDCELALYLAFLTCDLKMKHLSHEELSSINATIAKKFVLPENIDGTSKEAIEIKQEIQMEVENFFQHQPGMIKSLLAGSKTFQELFLKPLADEDDDDDDDKDYNIEAEENLENSSSSEGTDREDEEELNVKEIDVNASTEMDVDDDKPLAKAKEEKPNKDCIQENMDASETKVSNFINPVAAPKEILEVSKENTEENDPLEAKEFTDAKENEPLVGLGCGSTATVVLLNEKNVYIANVGDSKCVASINGKATKLSVDHIPTDKEEQQRIVTSGCRVTQDGRINGSLNMSRAFGDFGLKKGDTQEPFQALSIEPSIKVNMISEVDFLVIASDGVWDILSPEDVVNFIKERREDEAIDICAELFELLLPQDVTDDGIGFDNMSAIILFFEKSDITCNRKCVSVKYRYGLKKEKKTTMKESQPGDSDAVAECNRTQQWYSSAEDVFKYTSEDTGTVPEHISSKIQSSTPLEDIDINDIVEPITPDTSGSNEALQNHTSADKIIDVVEPIPSKLGLGPHAGTSNDEVNILNILLPPPQTQIHQGSGGNFKPPVIEVIDITNDDSPDQPYINLSVEERLLKNPLDIFLEDFSTHSDVQQQHEQQNVCNIIRESPESPDPEYNNEPNLKKKNRAIMKSKSSQNCQDRDTGLYSPRSPNSEEEGPHSPKSHEDDCNKSTF